jgi:hypothetical protein
MPDPAAGARENTDRRRTGVIQVPAWIGPFQLKMRDILAPKATTDPVMARHIQAFWAPETPDNIGLPVAGEGQRRSGKERRAPTIGMEIFKGSGGGGAKTIREGAAGADDRHGDF